MRICRFQDGGSTAVGIYRDSFVVPLDAARSTYERATRQTCPLPDSVSLLDYLPPDGAAFAHVQKLDQWLDQHADELPPSACRATDQIELLVPIPRPNKLFLLAGNYGEHIEEGGGIAPERLETFPYVFMKPPSTTLTDPGKPVRIPAVSPDHIDWELELAVVIGRRAKRVSESEALKYVAGYTVINDISNRRFRPNPRRRERPKDAFFDWLHGKWHDTFCPCGPCVTSADAMANPQKLALELRHNGQVRQKATTGQMIFPVAAVIEFISSFVTLEPGDLISTGTPAGVGNASGIYLKPGDRLEASISGIGTLVSPVEAEEES